MLNDNSSEYIFSLINKLRASLVIKECLLTPLGGLLVQTAWLGPTRTRLANRRALPAHLVITLGWRLSSVYPAV